MGEPCLPCAFCARPIAEDADYCTDRCERLHGAEMAARSARGPRLALCGHLRPRYRGNVRRFCEVCEWVAAAEAEAHVLRRQLAKLPKPRRYANCLTCAGSLEGKYPTAKFCSPKCSRDGQPKGCATPGCDRPLRAKGMCNVCYRKSRGENSTWTDAKRDRHHRRRALRRAATTGRPVLLSEIRERDGNRCHLCRKTVPAKAYPHPLSPSLDHVVPLSKGGAHDPDNVRLAHLRCNIEKGADGGNEQLLLIG